MRGKHLALNHEKGTSFAIPDLTVAKVIPFTEGVLNCPVGFPI